MSRLARHVILRFWLDALLVAAVVVALFTGLSLALLKPDETAPGRELARGVVRVLPLLPAPVAFLAAVLGLARMHGERTLVALASSGSSGSRVGVALLAAALPLALLAFGLEAFPPGAGSVPARVEAWGAPLAGGGFWLRGRPGDDAAPDGVTRSALLLPAAGDDGAPSAPGRVLFGLPSARHDPATGAIALAVHETWLLANDGSAAIEVEATPSAWSGRALVTPRSLVWGRDAGPLSLSTLAAWSAAEPGRADLRFARDARLREGLRVLVFLALALALLQRATLDPFLPRAAAASVACVLYVATDLGLGSLGVLGIVPPSVAALGPALAFGLGAGLWARALPRISAARASA